MVGEPVRDEHRIGVLDERLSRLSLLTEQRLLGGEPVDPGLQRSDPALEIAPFRLVDEPAARDADADEDAHDQRDEHRAERGDVVTEVEHSGLYSVAAVCTRS